MSLEEFVQYWESLGEPEQSNMIELYEVFLHQDTYLSEEII